MYKAMYKARGWGFVAVALVVFGLGILFAPSASADTLFIGVSAATSCGGATLCSGGSPYSVSELLDGAESLPSLGTFLLDNDSGIGTFSDTFAASLLPANDALECEVSGPIDGAATSCSIAGSLGTDTSGQIYGPGTSTGNITITFSDLPTCGAIAANCMFDLTIADNPTTAPEPSTIVLLGMGFASLFGLAYWKPGVLRFGFRG